MSLEHPSEITVWELADGIRYQLRGQQYIWVHGCVGIFGVIPLVAAWYGASFLLGQPLGAGEAFAWAAMSSMVLWSGYWMLPVGLGILVHRITVELRGRWLWRGMRLGPWRSGCSQPVAAIIRLRVHGEPDQTQSTKEEADGTLASVDQAVRSYQLIVETATEPAQVIAYHANEEPLRWLGEDLRKRLLENPEAAIAPGLRQPVSVIDELVNGPVSTNEQPSHSCIQCEEQLDGVTLTFPPISIRETEGLFWFCNKLAFVVGTPVLFWLWLQQDTGGAIWFLILIGLNWLFTMLTALQRNQFSGG